MEVPGEDQVEDEEDIQDEQASIIRRSTQRSIKSGIVRSESSRITQISLKSEKQVQMISLPGIWTPLNPETKVLSMKIFFPAITQKFDLPEPEEIPPHLIVAFDAFKEKEVLQLAQEYPQETMRIGFFTSADPDDAKCIAKTIHAYEHIPAPP